MNAQEYALYRGKSKMTVSKWIRHGKISAVRVGHEYQIDPEIADRELAESLNQAQQRIPKASSPQDRSINPERPLTADNKHIAEPIKGGPTFAEAQRAREVYRAERERLRLLQEKGELVVAADIKKEITSLMRTVRDSMMGIPDRIASQAAAMKETHQVHQLISSEIRTALRALADD